MDWPPAVGLDGTPIAWPKPESRTALVLVFLGHDCPISNTYAPELGRILGDFTSKRITFVLVYPEPDLSAEEARRHRAEFGLSRAPTVLDQKLKLAKAAEVTIKPEVAVYAGDGKQVYRGRIDDRYLDFRRQRAQPVEHDLRTVLAALKADRVVEPRTTKAIGCSIDFPARP